MITPLPPKTTRENGAQRRYSTQNDGWVSLGQFSGRIPDVEISHEFLWIFRRHKFGPILPRDGVTLMSQIPWKQDVFGI